MTDLKLKDLRYLVAVADCLHFGRAAEACGVTQPTLSAGIKQLEDILGVLLVQRGSRFHAFTPEGQRTLEWARRMVGDERALRQEMRALKQGLAGHIRIAAVPTALAMVASLTTPFRALHPDVSFTVLSCTSIAILGMLENLEIDAGLTYLDNEPLGRVTAVPLYRETYRLLTTADAPLGSRKRVTWAELSQAPLALLTPDTQTRRIIDGLLRSANGGPQAALESDSMLLLFAHVRTGRWASVIPTKIVETLSPSGPIRAIPIVEPEAVPVTRRRGIETRAAAASAESGEALSVPRGRREVPECRRGDRIGGHFDHPRGQGPVTGGCADYRLRPAGSRREHYGA